MSDFLSPAINARIKEKNMEQKGSPYCENGEHVYATHNVPGLLVQVRQCTICPEYDKEFMNGQIKQTPRVNSPSDLRDDISDIFVSYGVDEPEYNPYKAADEVINLFLDTIEKAKPEMFGVVNPAHNNNQYIHDKAIRDFEEALVKEIKK